MIISLHVGIEHWGGISKAIYLNLTPKLFVCALRRTSS